MRVQILPLFTNPVFSFSLVIGKFRILNSQSSIRTWDESS